MTEVDDALRWLKDACALILHEGSARGSAYLIEADLLATCAHVVRGIAPGGTVQARFPWGEAAAQLERVDEVNDAAVLRLGQKVSVAPLRRASESSNQAQWLSFGYPRLARVVGTDQQTGVLIEGVVRDAAATDTRGTATLQLFSSDIAAGRGAAPHGLSGSPVLVRGAVVGHLKLILLDKELARDEMASPRAELGLVYACPIRCVEALAGLKGGKKARPPQPPGAPYDRSWYVHRETEERLALSHLEVPGAPVVLWGPELFGKSTLLSYLLEHVRQNDLLEGRTTEVIDVNLASLFQQGPATNLNELLEHFARNIVQETGGQDEWVSKLVGKPLPWALKLSQLMKERVLSRQADRIVLAIESGDAVWGQSFQGDFYGMFRHWCQLGHSEPWSKLRLVIALSTTPSLVMDGPNSTVSPWNLVAPIELRDFRPAEVETLARLYGLGWSREELESKLITLVGGHPYLLRTIMHRASLLGVPLQALSEDAEVLDQLFAEHLGTLGVRLEQEPKLADAVRRILTTPRTPLDEETFQRLRRAGLVVRNGSGVFIRYKLYEMYLRQRWQISTHS